MTTYVGVDVGKKSLQVYCPQTKKSSAVANSLSGWTKLLEQLQRNYPELSDLVMIFEPTGGYEHGFREFLKAHAIAFVTAHPNKVRRYAQACGWLSKTDVIDSKLLSEYAYAFKLQPKLYEYHPEQALLRAYLQRRQQLMMMKNQETNRQEQMHVESVTQSLAHHVAYLDQELAVINQQIQTLTTHPTIKAPFDILTSIPGVGVTLATTVITELPALIESTPKQITSLVGLAPFAKDSGKYRGKRSLFAGRSQLRKILYMASVASLRVNQSLKACYQRLINNHKSPKVALVAVMRKLLLLMQALLKNNTPWLQNYAQPNI